MAPTAAAHQTPEAERRQLTVLFCDLADSTLLASQLDPEEWREVVRASQDTCAKVIQRYEVYIAQYLGDGLLVYFGYPQAHEDDAPRAVRTGLEMLQAMDSRRACLAQEWGVGLAVRLRIYTGLVVVGAMGGGDRQEQLALGETPNIAARLQGLAAPDTAVLSAPTYRLVEGFFACHDLDARALTGGVLVTEVSPVASAPTVDRWHWPSARHRCSRSPMRCRRSAHNLLLLGPPGAGRSIANINGARAWRPLITSMRTVSPGEHMPSPPSGGRVAPTPPEPPAAGHTRRSPASR